MQPRRHFRVFRAASRRKWLCASGAGHHGIGHPAMTSGTQPRATTTRCLPCRSLLEVGVRLTDGTLTSLRISLPPAFPGDRPALSITSPVRHPWVDSIGRLSFPLLDRWGAPSVRLAAVVADAFKGLGGAPAPLPSHGQAPAAGAAGRPQQQQAGAAPPPSLQQHAAGTSSEAGGSAVGHLPAAPAIPTTFPEVEGMSTEQLSHALADGATYKRLVDQIAHRLGLFQVGATHAAAATCPSLRQHTVLTRVLPPLRRLLQGVEKLKAATLDLAAANLASGEEQGDKRNQMAIIRSSEYAPAKAAFDDKWARQQAVLSKLSPDVLMRRCACVVVVVCVGWGGGWWRRRWLEAVRLPPGGAAGWAVTPSAKQCRRLLPCSPTAAAAGCRRA